MTHEHIITDLDGAFVIDAAKRSISNPSGKMVLIQYDHNSERFGFTIPRFVEGHDMSESTSIQIHYINVGSGQESNSGVYGVTDAAVDPANDEMIRFSWLVSSNCTQLVGSLAFAVRFSCVKNGITEYSWGTQSYSGITISNSIQNTETVVMEHADIIAAWEARIAALEDDMARTTNPIPDNSVEGQMLSVNGAGELVWVNLDLSPYAKTTDVESDISAALSEAKSYADSSETDAVNTAKIYTDQQITAIDIPTVPTNVSAFTNDKGYLTSIPSEYITESELTAKGYLTNVPSEYVTETELTNKGYQTADQVNSIVNTALGVIENGSY